MMSLPSLTKRSRNAPSIKSRSSAGSPHAANKDCRNSERGRRKLGLVFGQRQRRLERPFLKSGDERWRVETASHIIARGAQGFAITMALAGVSRPTA